MPFLDSIMTPLAKRIIEEEDKVILQRIIKNNDVDNTFHLIHAFRINLSTILKLLYGPENVRLYEGKRLKIRELLSESEKKYYFNTIDDCKKNMLNYFLEIPRPQSKNRESNKYALLQLVDSAKKTLRIFTKTCKNHLIRDIEEHLNLWLDEDQKREIFLITQNSTQKNTFSHSRIEKVIYDPKSEEIQNSYFFKLRGGDKDDCTIRACLADEVGFKLTNINPPKSISVINFNRPNLTLRLNRYFDKLFNKLSEK